MVIDPVWTPPTSWCLMLVAGAVATLLWPPRQTPIPFGGWGSTGTTATGSGRVRSALAGTSHRWTSLVSTTLGSALVGGTAVGAVTGVLPGIAAATAAATAIRLAARYRAGRAARRELDSLLAGLRMLVRELRAGAAAPAAAAAVADAIGGRPGRMLADLAAAARMGIERPLPEHAGPTGELAPRLHSGLTLSVRHGVPWAALVETACTELADRVRTEGARAAQIAGPRFSGYVLAALPVFGLVLGSGLGADPLAVLFGPAPGGLLLPAGTALVCLGLIWSARIVR